MENKKQLEELALIEAAGLFFSGANPLEEYEKLKAAYDDEETNGSDLASDFALMWQPFESSINLEDAINQIEGLRDNIIQFGSKYYELQQPVKKQVLLSVVHKSNEDLTTQFVKVDYEKTPHLIGTYDNLNESDVDTDQVKKLLRKLEIKYNHYEDKLVITEVPSLTETENFNFIVK